MFIKVHVKTQQKGIPIVWLFNGFKLTVKYYECAHVVCAPENAVIYSLCRLRPTKKKAHTVLRSQIVEFDIHKLS